MALNFGINEKLQFINQGSLDIEWEQHTLKDKLYKQ